MEKENEWVYPSKVDWWVGLIMIGVPVVHVPLGVLVMTKGFTLFGIGLIFWGLIIAAIIAALSWPCRYTVTDSSLIIQSGLVTDSIALSRITEATPKRTAMAAPALSLDRIVIKLNDGTERIISPVKQEEFLSRIKAES